MTAIELTRPELAGSAPWLLAAGGSGDAPGVKLLALVVGILLVVAAIRAMFGKRK